MQPKSVFEGGGRVSLFYVCFLSCGFGHFSVTTSCLADIGVRTVYDGLVFLPSLFCLLGVNVTALGQLYTLLTFCLQVCKLDL